MTVREKLEQLPEPYRTQAINNSVREDLKYLNSESMQQNSFEELTLSFTWKDSTEGQQYWVEAYSSFRRLHLNKVS